MFGHAPDALVLEPMVPPSRERLLKILFSGSCAASPTTQTVRPVILKVWPAAPIVKSSPYVQLKVALAAGESAHATLLRLLPAALFRLASGRGRSSRTVAAFKVVAAKMTATVSNFTL